MGLLGEPMQNINELMQNPAFLMGMNMMGNNQGAGMALGPAMGKAGINTARDLQRIETASANRTWRAKQSAIQEERNRVMMDYNQKRLDASERKYAEEERKNKATEAMYSASPQPVKEGDNTVGYTYGGRFSQKPKLSPLDMMLMNQMMPYSGMGGPPGNKPVGPADVMKGLGAPQAQAPGPSMMPQANASTMPQSQPMDVGFNPNQMGGGRPSPMTINPEAQPSPQQEQQKQGVQMQLQRAIASGDQVAIQKAKQMWQWLNQTTVPYGQ